jgi:hypothetical protein
MTEAILGNEEKALSIAMANEPDNSHLNTIKRMVSGLMVIPKQINGKLVFSDEVGYKKLGSSIVVSYLYYVVGDTELLIRCRTRNIGSGWQFRGVFISSGEEMDRFFSQ